MGITQDIAALADEAVARLRADLVDVLARMRQHLKDLLAKAQVDAEGRLVDSQLNLEIAAGLERDVRGLLAEMGYDAAADQAVNDFERMASLVEGSLGASFTTITREALVAFVAGVVSELTQHVPRDAQEALRKAMVAGVTSHAPREDLLNELARQAEITLRQAVTEVDTSIMVFARESLTTSAEEAGFDLFRYDGPDDGLTRPFCAEHVGRVFTAGDLDAEDNGQGLAPTSRFLGGYVCRHALSPITLEEALAMVAKYGERIIGGPEARRIVLRGGVGSNEAAFVQKYAGRVVGGRVVRRRRRAA